MKRVYPRALTDPVKAKDAPVLSLSQIATSHSPLILLDAASSRCYAGIFQAGRARWEEEEGDAGTAIFRCLERLGAEPAGAAAFAFCDGPGSILGIRSAAVAIRCWAALAPRPVYAYHSLALAAAALGRPEATLIADARRGHWHAFRPGRGLERAAASELRGPLITPGEFRAWSPLPEGTETAPYSLPDLLSRASEAALFRPVAEPDAFLHREPEYATWTPAVHRAP